MYDQEEIITQIKSHNERNGGWDQVYQYINQCYAWFETLPAGKVYSVQSMYPDTNDADLFTNILKLYILTCSTTITFIRNDFKQFRKNRSP